MNYDIYGVGAALLDTEVLVSDKFLASNNISKGVMTLVEENHQNKLIRDLITQNIKLHKKCGGSVCNSLVAATNFGAKTFFSGKVGDDLDGRIFVDDLMASGVTFQGVSSCRSGATGRCLVLVTQDAERTMHTYLGVSDSLGDKEIDARALQKSSWLYLEGYLVTNLSRVTMLIDLLSIAKRDKVKIAVSLSDPFIASIYRNSLAKILATGVDLIFCNKHEALSFTETKSIEHAFEVLKGYASNLVITDGSNGSISYDGSQITESRGIKVDALDTTGAGDMFAGSFLYAINSGRSFSWAAEFSNYCASEVVKKMGPRLEEPEYMKIRNKFDL